MSTLSVVINTLNEEKMIANAISSAFQISADVVVVDMMSDDATRSIAASLGVRIIDHCQIGYVEPARKKGIDHCHSEWIFILDADEVIEPKLAAFINRVIFLDSSDAVYIPRRNYLLGKIMQHSGWGPDQDHQLRLFKKNAVDISNIIHKSIRLREGKMLLKPSIEESGGIVHFNYNNLDHFLEKLNRYTTIEADNHCDRRVRLWGPIYRGLREIIIRLFFKRGYKDGWRGLYLSICMGFYRFIENAKIYEATLIGSGKDIEKMYVDLGRHINES